MGFPCFLALDKPRIGKAVLARPSRMANSNKTILATGPRHNYKKRRLTSGNYEEFGMNRQTLIQKLKEDIAQGHVVIIAGTGVSIAACGNQLIENHPVASWPGLLQNGLEYCLSLGVADKEDAEVLGKQIKSNKTNFLISAAEDISHRLQDYSPGTYRGWLNDTVGKLVPKHREILDALTALPGVLATLNYDGLIEQTSNRKPVTWLREAKVQEVLRREITEAVLHIHGFFDEPESVVLGLSSYAKVAGHAHTKAVLQLFTIDRTLLFVGCGAL
jgi:hypothetical protein